jgi:hypothetical protein
LKGERECICVLAEVINPQIKKIGFANHKSAKSHICGRSSNLKNYLSLHICEFAVRRNYFRIALSFDRKCARSLTSLPCVHSRRRGLRRPSPVRSPFSQLISAGIREFQRGSPSRVLFKRECQHFMKIYYKYKYK